MSTHSTYAQMDNYFHEHRAEYLVNCALEESYATPVHQVYHGLHLNRFPLDPLLETSALVMLFSCFMWWTQASNDDLTLLQWMLAGIVPLDLPHSPTREVA